MKRTISLDGDDWQLREFEFGTGKKARAYLPDRESDDWVPGLSMERKSWNWIPARVPGDVHLDLASAGIIGEPLFGQHAKACKWVSEREWWYRKEFFVADDFGERVELQFNGLDAVAEIWLNGKKIGEHSNSFIPYSVNVSNCMKKGQNLLAVRVEAGLDAARRKDWSRYGGAFGVIHGPRVWTRKPQYTFGWDWAPELLTCGMWRSVAAFSHDEIAIRTVAIRPKFVATNRAVMEIETVIENLTDSRQKVHLETQCKRAGKENGKDMPAETLPGVNTCTLEVEIKNPSLWWPNSCGAPALYDFEVSVRAGSHTLDMFSTKSGIRKVKLLQEPLPDDEGTSFVFAINGEKVFCKGANWVPLDSIPARVTREKYRATLERLRDANINMLRVWGGGIYEDPVFYDLCDELGIMVWQDFAYACGYYPDDDAEFLAEARREAECIIKELRNHPSVVLWCGNNEIDITFYEMNAKRNPFFETFTPVDRFYGRKIFHELLPEVCARLDPSRPYWPSSPYGGKDPNSHESGDCHNWQPFFDKENPTRLGYYDHLKNHAKFVSEYGILGTPPLESLACFLPENERRVNSPSWQFHANTIDRSSRDMNEVICHYWKEPSEISSEEYILAGQMIQAEGLKVAMEHYRRRKFFCGGTLYWNCVECWGTTIGWAPIDYYGNCRALYYYTRRAYAPILVSFEPAGSSIFVWVANDTLSSLEAQLEFGILGFDGKMFSSKRERIFVPGNTSAKVAELKVSGISESEKERLFCWARLTQEGKTLSENRHFLVPFAKLKLDKPRIVIKRIETGKVGLTADSFAFFVYLSADGKIEPNDNFFDLWPHQERLIDVPAGGISLVTLTRSKE